MSMTMSPTDAQGTVLRQRSDADLIAATRNGDLAAYGELYRRHVDVCTQFARRRCRNRHTADDVVSEVFAATLQAITNGRGPTDDLAPYVMRSVGHQAARVRTRGDGGRTVPTDPSDFSPFRDSASTDRHEDQLVTTQAFRRLPDRFRRVLWATEVEGCSHADLGERLGLREPAVAALARRARQAFATAYLDVRANSSATDPNCADVRRTLASYVRGNVCSSTRTKVDDHLDDCTECADVVRGMRQLSTSLRSVPWLAPASVLGASRWALVAQRIGIAAGSAEIPKIVASCALGLSLLAAPTGPDLPVRPHEVVDRPAAGLLDRTELDADAFRTHEQPGGDRTDRVVDEPSPAGGVEPPTAGLLDRTDPDLLLPNEAEGDGADASVRTDPADAAVDRSPGPSIVPSPGAPDAPTSAPTRALGSGGDTSTPAVQPGTTPSDSGSGGAQLDLLDGTADVGILTPDGALTIDVLDGTADVGIITPDGPVQLGLGGNDVGGFVEDTVGDTVDDAVEVVDGLLDTTGDAIERSGDDQSGDVVRDLVGGLLGS